jgi:DNA-binding NtrC family response regulator
VKPQSQTRVLVVDDEGDLRMLLSNVVSGAGYDVTTAEDGEDAIEKLQTSRFDIALLDIQMPNKTGIDVLKFIQKSSAHTKSIILTGYADLKHAMEAKEFGALDFISKPYKLEEVISTIERVMK